MTGKIGSRWHLVLVSAVALLATAAEPSAPSVPAAPVNPSLWPAPASPFRKDAQLDQRVATLLARMTLEEKIGQVIQPDIGSVTPEDMRRYRFGAILNGGNSAPG